jgi:hypothetical protein
MKVELQNKTPLASSSDDPAAIKKAYEPPRVQEFGALSDLTGGPNTTGTDDAVFGASGGGT